MTKTKSLESTFRKAGASGNKLHVISRSGKWIVVKEGASRASVITSTKSQAKKVAEKYLKEKNASALIIHKKDGRIESWKSTS